MDFFRHFLLALQFFTRLPVTGRLAAWASYNPQRQRASVAHLPGVGVLVGAVAASAYLLVRLALPDLPAAPWVAAVLATAAGVWLTGGLHEDGLADVADGLGGSADRDRALVIMKDSRVGAYGVLALVLALLLKVALLVLLDQYDETLLLVLAALLGAQVVSRLAPLLLMQFLPYVGEAAQSKAGALTGRLTAGQWAVALGWSVAALALPVWALPEFGWHWPVLAVAAATVAMGRWFSRRLQGITGDCLGATQQVCELAFYLGLACAP